MREAVYVQILIDRVNKNINRLFTYQVPEHLLNSVGIGKRVEVPFGNSKAKGYILKITDSNTLQHDIKIKKVISVLDENPLFGIKELKLVKWMVDQYGCMLAEALRTIVPSEIRKGHSKKSIKYITLNCEIDNDKIEAVKKRSIYMAEILNCLKINNTLSIKQIKDKTGSPDSSFKALEKRGFIRIENKRILRNPYEYTTVEENEYNLSNDQMNSLNSIKSGMDKGFSRFLLYGVTSSGKTLVYLNAIKYALSLGKQAIVLVPEISLTPQTVERFKNWFDDKVAVLHSSLSKGERLDEWTRIHRGDANIVVGARSAVFAPLKNIGIIIIDEEHTESYKSDNSPRYCAVDVAEKRCEIENAVLVLGSATPDIKHYFQAKKNKYTLLYMKNRIGNKPLPDTAIVDMREELKSGNRSIFSQRLYQEIRKALQYNKKIILLLNRRGYAQFVSCRSCGYVVKCTRCDVSMTYHKNYNALICHYCGFQIKLPEICPKCKSKYIKQFGIGTEKAQNEIERVFPQAKVVRMDADTTTRKDSHRKILDSFKRGDYNILLGTQMIAKGLDIEGVDLVGILAADSGLNIPDYKSCERTFQLIVQAAGRSGRRESKGLVIIQTYQSEHYAVNLASKHNYEGFYNKEIELRKRFQYPPFVDLTKILMTGTDKQSIIKCLKNIETWLKDNISKNTVINTGLIEIGTYSAAIEKIKEKYRWQIIIKTIANDKCRNELKRIVYSAAEHFEFRKNSIIIDFNPRSLM